MHAAVGEYTQVVLTRSAQGSVQDCVDGVRQWQLTDTTGDAIIGTRNVLRFLVDNTSDGTTEMSAGAVARIRVFDRPLSASEIRALGQTPGSPCFVP